MIKIPKVMSTQHPDNVNIPFFAESSDMSGDDEVQEAYYAFSHLGCDEQMWDSEGKEVDDFVVRKLLSKYPHFFKQHRLGQDVFITLRLPNPSIEKTEAKILVEALESIPRSADAAKLFYNDLTYPPIFEVILPMTTSAEELNRVYYFYKNFISGKQYQQIYPGDISIANWVGSFNPESINVIPLIEDIDTMLKADKIIISYLENKQIDYLRVFLARSDPALNYSMISAVLANKIALKSLEDVSKNTGIKIYPIIGMGSPPFRGNLTPYNVEKVLQEYSSVETFTVQSAFKYDNRVEDVIAAIKKIKNFIRVPIKELDKELALKFIEKSKVEYQRIIEKIAVLINEIASFIPKRRTRKLHIGLFGYTRKLGKIKLPRAISFCAACYSIGLPPEIIGLSAFNKEELNQLKQLYTNLEFDIACAIKYFNSNCLELFDTEIKEIIIKSLNLINTLDLETSINTEHKEITDRIIKEIKQPITSNITELIIEAAYLRKFLG